LDSSILHGPPPSPLHALLGGSSITSIWSLK
jgi:hypothetical protein